MRRQYPLPTHQYQRRSNCGAYGIRIAVFYTKVYGRLLVPLTAADQAQAPAELRHALDVISQHVDDYIDRARLGKAA